MSTKYSWTWISMYCSTIYNYILDLCYHKDITSLSTKEPIIIKEFSCVPKPEPVYPPLHLSYLYITSVCVELCPHFTLSLEQA